MNKNWKNVMIFPELGLCVTIFSNVNTLEQQPPKIKPNIKVQSWIVNCATALTVVAILLPALLEVDGGDVFGLDIVLRHREDDEEMRSASRTGRVNK
ncbi:hypothetical protein WICPIJ_000743 [Wickerhamomyces pijperi]|uniref:Uncharacterized protein n=1 Tax=Wickerhamomyces pijperi TaxID=599730 RepID=A0A9P8QFE1_WICPI|nr:hypothetical protein WICPIJ_000743 [Wickerhamomyces pijperi]